MLMCAPSKAVGACAQGNPPKRAGMGTPLSCPTSQYWELATFPAFSSKTEEVTNSPRGHQCSTDQQVFKTPLPVPGAMRRGHRVLTVCVLLELGKLGGAERDPPTVTHLPVVGHKPLCSLCWA